MKDAQLAQSFTRDATRRDVRHRTVREREARVGDVDLGRQYRHAHRLDVRHSQSDERMHEIEVVDHEIEHDGHIGAARTERRETVALDKPGAIDKRHRRADRTIKPFDVTNLQQHTGRSRPRQQIVGFVKRHRERLLDEYVLAAIDRRRCNRMVSGRRHHDGDGVNLVEHRRQRGVHTHAVLGRDVSGTTGVLVEEACKTITAQIAQNAHVVHAQATGADDANARCIALRKGARLRGHGRGSQNPTPRWLASMKSRKCRTSGSMVSSARARSTP